MSIQGISSFGAAQSYWQSFSGLAGEDAQQLFAGIYAAQEGVLAADGSKKNVQKDAVAPSGQALSATGEELSEDDLAMIRDLEARDREVRQHEAAHQAAGAGYAGSATFSYQRGPDGKLYAIGGEVSIDTSTSDDPQATIDKMRIVHAAALAPANPSDQDRRVAAQAMMAMMQAQRELGSSMADKDKSGASAATKSTDEAGAFEREQANQAYKSAAAFAA